MGNFEKKYGFKEDEKIEAFHRSRRMFCIYENKLRIARPKLPYSHADWFEREGWISKEDDSLMKQLVRGIVDSKGDIYFYAGYDFRVDEKAAEIFFSHLGELVRRLKIKPSARVLGGLTKSVWKPIKDFGTVREILRK
jgi:hypothetical protein